MPSRERDDEYVIAPRQEQKRRIEYAENQQTHAAEFE